MLRPFSLPEAETEADAAVHLHSLTLPLTPPLTLPCFQTAPSPSAGSTSRAGRCRWGRTRRSSQLQLLVELLLGLGDQVLEQLVVVLEHPRELALEALEPERRLGDLGPDHEHGLVGCFLFILPDALLHVSHPCELLHRRRGLHFLLAAQPEPSHRLGLRHRRVDHVRHHVRHALDLPLLGLGHAPRLLELHQRSQLPNHAGDLRTAGIQPRSPKLGARLLHRPCEIPFVLSLRARHHRILALLALARTRPFDGHEVEVSDDGGVGVVQCPPARHARKRGGAVG
eukprot:1184643-Rhodomonas_salina.1